MAVSRAESIINADIRATELNLEGLLLESLDPILPLLAKMPRLKSLKLSRNKLTGLPVDLSCIRQLEYLDISDNPITGLSTIMRGLYGLVILRHLYIDLPFESEEDEIIVAMQSLESFNGTSLMETFEDAENSDEGKDVSPPPFNKEEMVNTSIYVDPNQSNLFKEKQQQQQHILSSNSHSWNSEDTSKIQELYSMVTGISGNISSQNEFNSYVSNVVQHLNSLTDVGVDTDTREGETLKAKKVLYEYCLDELSHAATRKDNALGQVFKTILKAQTNLLERYDRLWRHIADDKNERIAIMKKDMQDAIHEIESLMGQVSNGSSGRGGGTTVDESEISQLQEEIARLRTDNERLQTKLRLSETTPGCNINNISETAIRRLSVSTDRPQASPSRSQLPQFGNKVLTLKQLKSTIEDIYASKSKYDIKCSESHLPRETMEQHMYTYLNQRYGLKHIILDWATAIIHGIKKYCTEENDVAVFGKILRNEIDEEFRFVQRQVRETVHELLRVYVKGKRPSKSDTEINRIVQKKITGTLLEDEWVDIIKYMYNTEDAVSIIMRVRDHLRQMSQPRRRRALQRGHEPEISEEVQLQYCDLIRILLDFQLEGHEKFLSRFLSIFQKYDTDRNGIINAQEFSAIVKSLDNHKTNEDVMAVMELIDPFGNQLITFSECVTFLSAEIVKMMKTEENG